MGLIGHILVGKTALAQFPKSLVCAVHGTCITLHCLNCSDRKQHLQTSIPAGHNAIEVAQSPVL